LKIVPLVERPELVEQVAAWGFAEWGHLNPGQTRQSRTARIRETMNADRVPIVLIALDDADMLVGTASLLFDDLEGDPRNPWLASVFVPAGQRGKGIASALVVAMEDSARRLGYPTLLCSRPRPPRCTLVSVGARLSAARIAANISR
jgi:predicted N-acetyltransferase YhbS